MSLQFRDHDVMWDHVKGLTEVRVDGIGQSSLVDRCGQHQMLGVGLPIPWTSCAFKDVFKYDRVESC